MSLRIALQAVIRLAIAAGVGLTAVTFSADDAEARRGGKVRMTKERATSHDATTKRKSDDHDEQGADNSGGTYVPRVRSREASRSQSETTTDAGSASPRRAGTPSPIPAATLDKDIDVPGCAAGMICTVCLAGCDGSINRIVDAQPMTPRPKPRE
jgi:hypothetical protein